MEVRFFGKLGDRLGRVVDVPIAEPVRTIADLRAMLIAAHPEAAADLSSHAARACIADEIVREDRPIGDLEVVEFLPPLSGG